MKRRMPPSCRPTAWLIAALGVVAGCLGTPDLRAAPMDLAVPEHRLDPTDLDPVWAERLTALRLKEPVAVAFREVRKNRFRRTDRTFEGTLRLDPAGGVSLHYPAPLDVTLVATAGVLWRRPGQSDWTAYTAEEDSPMGAWSEALWNFDFAPLAEAFDFFGRVTGETTWELYLVPKTRLPRIYLQIEDHRPALLELEPRPHQTTQFYLGTVVSDPDLAAWETFFPPAS